jgi:hypothetical protein
MMALRKHCQELWILRYPDKALGYRVPKAISRDRPHHSAH